MKRIIYILFIPILISCLNESKMPSTENDNSEKVLAYIKDLGFTENDIQEFPNLYIVQGDMAFPKDMIILEPILTDDGRIKQRQHAYLIGFANQNNIRVKIDPTMTAAPNMYWEIHESINEWNTVKAVGSRIRFTIVTGSTYGVDYDIIIRRNNNLAPCGIGQYPGGGTAGTYVEINKDILEPLTFVQRKATIMHELGHTIGFRHTDSTDGQPVPGYEGPDEWSIMKSCCCNFGGNNYLSADDKGATAVLYPTELPYGFGNSGSYPWIFTWQAPLYTGFGTLVGYETKHTRFDYQGNAHVSSVTFQTATNYTLPFTQGQYPGQNAIVSVRAKYSSGTFSSWVSYNCTL